MVLKRLARPAASDNTTWRVGIELGSDDADCNAPKNVCIAGARPGLIVREQRIHLTDLVDERVEPGERRRVEPHLIRRVLVRQRE